LNALNFLDVRLDSGLQQVVPDAVEVSLEVGIDRMGVAFLQVCINFQQRIFAASVGLKLHDSVS